MGKLAYMQLSPNLPAATPSEVEQTREYEPTYPLPTSFSQFQVLIDNEAEAVVQPMGGGCGQAGCVPGECCKECVRHMEQAGRAESLLLNTLTEPQSCLTSEEIELAMMWQLILAAQQADTVLPFFVQQLTGDGPTPEVSANECSDKFKVLASLYKHLSVTEEATTKYQQVFSFINEQG